MWSRGVSLANKCQLLFGAAVLLIVAAALVWPWIRQISVLDDAQLETSRQIAELWADSPLIDPAVAAVFRPKQSGEDPDERRNLEIRWWPIADWREASFPPGFLERAKRRLGSPINGTDTHAAEHVESHWDGKFRVYRYARLVRGADGGPQGVVVLDRRSPTVRRALLENQGFLIGAGVFAGSLAMIVFYLITTRIILQPVRALRETADRVRAGNTSVRSDLKTGDEFEQLAGAFNSMLANLEEQQTRLRGINKSLDLRLNELSERNTALYDAARLKGEFIANVSHELRTPLNSIIGFAEILQDTLPEVEAAQDADKIAKRRRYLDNIVGAGRTLLEMINDLLAMAKIEAGKIEIHVQSVNIGETCEALIALIRPLADRKSLRVVLQLQSSTGFVSDSRAADLPLILTDQQKFQQIIFNFLSNAVKFTPERGEVTLRAERLPGADGVGRVRVSVLDTGPGIASAQHQMVFEKFSQLDSGHTRQHQGTGLGLAISKEFAELLQGEIQLVSEVGRGSMFSLILPPAIDTERVQETKRGLAERAAVGARARK
ncbi:MAG: HAMP domain-containing histidine kinase [Phycisphaerae bacterium]|nr:HAMP domain-containing histidine kinase [Phycisphaerae bacterium]